MMNWYFADQNILREAESGYEIHLHKGTWFHPKRLKPVMHNKVERIDQMRLLRSGLRYIKSIGSNHNQNIEHSITTSLLDKAS